MVHGWRMVAPLRVRHMYATCNIGKHDTDGRAIIGVDVAPHHMYVCAYLPFPAGMRGVGRANILAKKIVKRTHPKIAPFQNPCHYVASYTKFIKGYIKLIQPFGHAVQCAVRNMFGFAA